MKCTTIIDKNREEEIIIYAHERTSLIDEIEELVSTKSLELFGYKDKCIIKLLPTDIFCFIVEENKIFALTNNDKIQLKQRLYEVEEKLDETFIKVNQSCIVNIKKISKFEASFSGAFMITLKNGYRDYVSRRQIKSVKERLGI